MTESTRKYFAEFLGTFTLVFVGTAVATLQQGIGDAVPAWGPGTGLLGISFAFGFTLMVLVYVVGPVSGCHINPAVTIPMAISGRLKWNLVPGYIIAQLVGAVVASMALWALLSGVDGYSLGVHQLGANGNLAGMPPEFLLGWEVLITALFLFTIFSATKEGANPAVCGLAIGSFLFVAHLIGAQLGDSSLNPARSFGPAIIQRGDALAVLWVFIVGPVIGGVIGYGLYRVANEE